ncbi:ATP synthase, subunit E [Tachypleus tridentatus]|uniref:ATP synthase, subunit E n=1 Tax=Tachypleus tridentatus TaxID=6853 RepID=UPI003FCEF03E
MTELAPPVRVSPFIRACRWGALTAGVLWGMTRYRSLSKKENALREYEEKQRVILEARRAEEKKRANKEELLYLAKESGVPIPPNFEEQFK